MVVTLFLKDSVTRVIALSCHNALGHALRAETEISPCDPLDAETLVGTPVRLEIAGEEGSVAIHHGIINSITAIATADPNAERLYSLDIRSAIEWLRLRKNARI